MANAITRYIRGQRISELLRLRREVLSPEALRLSNPREEERRVRMPRAIRGALHDIARKVKRLKLRRDDPNPEAEGV